MFLAKLLNYNHIAIQCHDSPDADSIAAGFGLYSFFRQRGREATLFYGGPSPLSKPNLLKMLELLRIPLQHCPQPREWPGLLLSVDCQHGAGNVAPMRGREVAVVDHHIQECPPPPLHEIRPYLGSCSTLVWHLLGEAGFEARRDLGEEAGERLHTALYYGLFMDTGALSEVRHPLDRDLRDSPGVSERILKILKTSNLSLEDLNLAAAALSGLSFNRPGRFAVVGVPPCDSNLLGFISDLVMQVDNIDVALVFSPVAGGVKYSVRSLQREAKASDIAAWVAENGLGSGGGHQEKAGGWLSADKLARHLSRALPEQRGGPEPAELAEYFNERLLAYQAAYSIIDRSVSASPPSPGGAEPGQSESLHEKRPLTLAYVPCAEVFPQRPYLYIRMLEGDIALAAGPDTYLMIGLSGEVYPIARRTFEAIYTPLAGEIRQHFPYKPAVLDKNSGQRLDLLALARPCRADGGGRVLARPLERGLKLFTRWDADNYIKGEPGDWLVRPEHDPLDTYIVKKDVFPRLYRKGGAAPSLEKDCSGLSLAAEAERVRVRKKIYPVRVAFASCGGVLQTLEGPVSYQPGDALVTGLAGESWPVAPERFRAAYQPVKADDWADGEYLTRPVKALALQMHAPFRLSRGGAAGDCLHGQAGDWLLQYGTDDYGIVRRKLFEQIYEIIGE